MKYCDRRGHSKLRLSSQKHHKPKPKFSRSRSLPTSLRLSIPLKNVNVLKVSLPLDLVSFKVSFPRSAYTSALLDSIDHLHDRMQCSKELPSGIMFCILYIFYITNVLI